MHLHLKITVSFRTSSRWRITLPFFSVSGHFDYRKLARLLHSESGLGEKGLQRRFPLTLSRFHFKFLSLSQFYEFYKWKLDKFKEEKRVVEVLSVGGHLDFVATWDLLPTFQWKRLTFVPICVTSGFYPPRKNKLEIYLPFLLTFFNLAENFLLLL